ncbi:HAMP domain-containing protein [Nitratireductor sp. CAU 1489]|uniref:HAMP domain-containing protein n=1 Tax=Nitratireductor arenosus TaxID=2682096 RepID=A0A844QKM4_9HYPH|nr:methyl-accepting chemotaxis protein [Nitratireductor arenosus]MVA98199.1 HAMP domain-containing protein [Nitratireductor arenosus]
MKNLAISKKLGLAFLAVISIIVAMSGAALWNLSAIERADAAAERSKSAAGAAMNARMALARVENSYRGYLLSMDKYYLERVDSHEANLRGQLAGLRALKQASPELVARIDAIAADVGTYRAQVIEAGKKLAADPIFRFKAIEMVGPTGTADGLIEPIENGIDAFIAEEVETNARNSAAVTTAVADANTALYGGLAVAVLLAAALGYLLSRSIATPIRGLTSVMGRLAEGDNQIEVPATGRGDEVGRMAQAVRIFKDAAIEKLRVEAQAVELRETGEAERNRTEAEKAREAAEDHVAVSALAEGLACLARGDLTHRIGIDFAPKTQQLKDDFNDAMARLQETMTTVTGAIGAMKTGTGEICQAADDLSRRTEQQAASLEETAAALDQVTRTVRQTAEDALQASRVSDEARDGAEKSGAVVRDAVGAMAQIEKSSEQIGQIIGVIDEIAFQTNLLALNAGVEAARAGDAGKGFAVVAQEVRALAQRSAEAAKEIKALISTSSGQVNQGVGLVAQTGEVLELIVGQVSEMSDLVKKIADAAQEQSTGLGQVNVAVNQMDQVTQQNAAMVEQSTAASHSLAKEADDLTRLVARFDVGGGRSVAGRETATRSAAPVAQLRTAGGRQAVATMPEADGWEEF